MNTGTRPLDRQNTELTAQKLLEQGYRVIVEPSLDQLPFNLGNYRPDLIAFKDQTGIILEVKEKKQYFSIDRLQEIAEIVASHPGWRFSVITVDDVDKNLLSNNESDLPSWETLQVKITEIETLVKNELLEPALLYLWSILESALRKQAIIQHLPIERFSSIKLLDYMYSSGEISIVEFNLIKPLLEQRNRIATD